MNICVYIILYIYAALDLLALDVGERLDAALWNIGVLFCIHTIYQLTTCQEIIPTSIPARLCRLRVPLMKWNQVSALTKYLIKLGSIGIEALYILEKFRENGVFELVTGHGCKITSWEHRRHMSYIPRTYETDRATPSSPSEPPLLNHAAQIYCLHELSSQFCSSEQVRVKLRGWKLVSSPLSSQLHDSC